MNFFKEKKLMFMRHQNDIVREAYLADPNFAKLFLIAHPNKHEKLFKSYYGHAYELILNGELNNFKEELKSKIAKRYESDPDFAKLADEVFDNFSGWLFDNEERRERK